MTTPLNIDIPTSIPFDEKLKTFNQNTDIRSTIKSLEEGKMILIKEFYSDGLVLLAGLHKHLKRKINNTTFKEQQNYRGKYRKLSKGIVLEILSQEITAKKAPAIGWLKEFSVKFEVNIHAWVLMTSHVHLLCTPCKENGVSQMMQALGRQYVRNGFR